MKANPNGPVDAIYLHHRHCSHPSRRPQPGRVRGNCSDLGDAGPAFEKAAQNFRVLALAGLLRRPPSGLNSCGPSPRIYPGPSCRHIQDGPGWVKSECLMRSTLLDSLALRKVRETGFQGCFLSDVSQPSLQDQRLAGRDASQDENGRP